MKIGSDKVNEIEPPNQRRLYPRMDMAGGISSNTPARQFMWHLCYLFFHKMPPDEKHQEKVHLDVLRLEVEVRLTELR